MLLQSLDQHAFEGLVVGILLKQRQSSHGPIQGVIDETGRSDSGATGHGGKSNREGRSLSTKKSCVPFLKKSRIGIQFRVRLP
jgi:hypothetical protein